MSEKNVLVLQSDRELKDWELDRLHEKILEQKELGVILLPPYVKVVKIPDGEIDGELVVMNCGECKPEPKEYAIKRNGWDYVLNVRTVYGNALLIDYTHNKMIAMRLSKAEAEKLLKKLGKGYEMEEL